MATLLLTINARIATIGERVEDYFYISELDNRPIEDLQRLQALQRGIIAALDVNQG